MNHCKKIAFVLALIAGLCGSAWAQEHHDRDHDRDQGYGQQNPNYQKGYNDGVSRGRWDVNKNRPYQPQNYSSYKNGDEAYRRGFMRGYDEAFGRHEHGAWEHERDHDRDYDRDRDHDRHRYESNPDYQRGYNDGLSRGRWDLSKNRPYQPQNYNSYKNGDEAYRRGFMAGYDEGIGRTRR